MSNDIRKKHTGEPGNGGQFGSRIRNEASRLLISPPESDPFEDDRGIDKKTAAGMLGALVSQHECTEACTGQTTLGDGTVIQLKCPYDILDPNDPKDRKIIGTMYASDARAAMGRG